MAITVVQRGKQATNSGSTATRTVTLSPAATAGNKIIAVGMIFDNTRGFAPTTPTIGNWTLDLTANPAASGQAFYVYSMDAAGGETTITFTTSDVANDTMQLFVYEVSGLVAGSTAKDKATSTALSGSVTSLATGSTGTLTQADEFALAAIFVNADGGTEAWTNSFGINGQTTTFGFCGDLIVSATTALNPTASWLTARQAHAGIVTYKMNTATNATPTPGVAAGVGTVPAPTLHTGETVTPGVIAGTVSIDSFGAEVATTASPSTVAGVVSIDAVTILHVDGPPASTRGDGYLYRRVRLRRFKRW